MKRKIKTVVLTSEESYRWKSMEEIIPAINGFWENLNSSTNEVLLVNLDQYKNTSDFSSLITSIITLENLVITCHTVRIFDLVGLLRNKLKLSFKLILYLHNQATIGLWPIRYFSQNHTLFLENDLFIGSCARDRLTLKLNYPKALYLTIPFSTSVDISSRKNLNNKVTYVYFGRISSQKNLHTLIIAFYIMRKEHSSFEWIFKIFGDEDSLGSPNMGVKDISYKKFLVSLIVKLNLEKNIFINDSIPRSSMREFAKQEKIIFVSASLHSDENFGMAALSLLMNKNNAVLSNWGGHLDLKKYFLKQVNLVPVGQSTHGPFICQISLARKLFKSSRNFNCKITSSKIIQTHIDRSSKYILRYVERKIYSSRKLHASKICNLILKRASDNFTENFMQIFNSYSDPLANRFFRAYGMKKQAKKVKLTTDTILPWVEVGANQIRVIDPHRGKIEYKILGNKNNKVIQTIDGKKINISSVDYKWLLRNGFLI